MRVVIVAQLQYDNIRFETAGLSSGFGVEHQCMCMPVSMLSEPTLILDFKPDLILLYKCLSDVKHIKTLTKAKVFCFYPHYEQHLLREVIELASYVDVLFISNSNKDLWQAYKQAGIKDIQFFTVGVDIDIFKPQAIECKFDFGIFQNDVHDPEVEWQRDLIYQGTARCYKFCFCGTGWDMKGTYITKHIPVCGEQLSKLFAQCNYILHLNDFDVPRWEILLSVMACNIPIVSTPFNHMQDLDVLIFEQHSFWPEVKDLLNTSPTICNTRPSIINLHTWDKRAQQLLNQYDLPQCS